MKDKTSFNVHSSGGLLSMQFLERLRREHCKEAYTNPESFSMSGEKPHSPREFNERVTNAWKTLLERWDDVSLDVRSYDISKSRRKWIVPLLRSLGYEPVYLKKDTAVPENGFKLALSHRGGDWESAPIIHTVSPSQDLDEKIEKGRGTKSPHDSVQMYLNSSSEDLWGVVTNGIVLRILRKYYHIYTKGCIEFDLESIFEERNYSDFLALYRMVHPSRFVPAEDGIPPLEHFYKKSLAAGEKIGDDLRKNVKAAIEVMANGFMTREMADRYISDQESCWDFYREILHVIYRIMFLMFAEQRGMLPSRDSLYADSYSMTRLRERAERTRRKDRHNDAWKGLLVTFNILSEGVEGMEVFGYNGGLFDQKETEILNELDCENTHLLGAIEYLTFFESEGTKQRISYVDLGVEEIGSIYESLLDYVPRVHAEDTVIDGELYPAGRFFLDPRGAKRKSTGSYYTNPRLVDELIKSALKPVVDDHLSGAGSSVAEREKAILSIKVCDPATGSGAFLIAANNYLGKELAKIRTETEYPSEQEERTARRDVLQHCIYGVDVNPMAVELAKVSLWINACVRDLPLNFLDHHIKCGNSLIGAIPGLMEKGIPDNAFKSVEGDDRETARKISKRNRIQKKNAILDGWLPRERKPQFPVTEFITLSNFREAEPEDVEEKKKRYESLVTSYDYEREKFIADTWTAAFFWPLLNERSEVPVQGTFRLIVEKGPSAMSGDFRKEVREMAQCYRFFHWHLEFPEVFSGDDPGFDCVLGNPPWDMLQAEEKPWFIVRDERIGMAPGSKRKKMIEELETTNPELHQEWLFYKRNVENSNKFFRHSGRFALTARGKLNYYPLFAEHDKQMTNSKGRVGIVIASGIATDYYNQDFFRDIVEKNQLVSLYDFENREGLFPGVHRSYKFSLLTITGEDLPAGEADFAFFLTSLEHMQEKERHFGLTDEDIGLLNPNTRTCPIFRSEKDAELTKKMYRRHPVLVKEKPNREDENPWGIAFKQGLFNMTSDSHLFKTEEELKKMSFELDGNIFRRDEETFLPLYEAKMIWQYDHRFAEFSSEAKGYGTVEATTEQHRDPNWEPMPRYWVSEKEVDKRIPRDIKWFLGFRDITNATNERTAVFSVFGRCAVSHKMPILLQKKNRPRKELILLCAIASSFIFDYIARQSMGGTSMCFYLVKQFALPPPSRIREAAVESIITRNFLSLFYTSYSLTPLAYDLGYDGSPLKWSPEARTYLRAELDAIIAHLYSIKRNELDYILETFPIVRRKDKAKYGEYRTKRLILEYYDKYASEIETDVPKD